MFVEGWPAHPQELGEELNEAFAPRLDLTGRTGVVGSGPLLFPSTGGTEVTLASRQMFEEQVRTTEHLRSFMTLLARQNDLLSGIRDTSALMANATTATASGIAALSRSLTKGGLLELVEHQARLRSGNRDAGIR